MSTYYEHRIPTKVHPDFKQKYIPIHDNGEKLVNIHHIQSDKISEMAQYNKQGIPGALNHCYVRESLVDLLEKAAIHLPTGFQFIIWDGYRPYPVQKAIYDQYYQKITREFPNENEQTWERRTTNFVSHPSVDPDHPAPHITGGAIDLAIIDDQKNLLPFGTAFDDFTEKANTAYYEILKEQRPFTKQETRILENRRLLYHALTDVGFSNYHQEWWHFDYGNQWWAQNKEKNTAIYGVADRGE
ncbi:M15 family metallopeptidase [Gracilibacillus sp. YIM 98692]|uniref:M15 family metallopeptidase n=1 Tax=Gracilibacillus sp. YIM 98692 TaxID=2663532 RepID=UPI0013CF430B|nr:M15 family metallopeptidase [Gracilibacillus sp. YIM 98692]